MDNCQEEPQEGSGLTNLTGLLLTAGLGGQMVQGRDFRLIWRVGDSS